MGFSLFGRKKPKRPVGDGPAATAPLAELFSKEAAPSVEAAVETLPRFKASAADQIDRRQSGRLTDMRMKLRNAFTPSQPVASREMFAGRKEVLSSMIAAIEDQKLHLVMYGERGIGKTSLLHMLTEAAREARYIVVYSSCGASSEFQETFRNAAADIPLLFHSGFGPTTEEVESGSTLADLLPANFSPRQFADHCVKLTGTRALIILDEFDRCDSLSFRRDLAELIKFLSDRSVRVQLVIGGVAGDLTGLLEHIPSIRRNILAVRLTRMTDAEVRLMIASGEKASGVLFAPDAQDFLVTLSRGWPYIASLLCHHAAMHAIDAGRSTTTAEDVSAAVDEALIEIRARMPKHVLQQIDRMMSEGAARMLSVLAGASLEAGGEFDATDIATMSDKAAEGASAKRLAEQLASERVLLETRDDVYGRRYCFLEESLGSYLWFLGAQQDQQKQGVRPQRVAS